MNRTLRWLYRTRLNKDVFLNYLWCMRELQMERDYREHLKCCRTQKLDKIRAYLTSAGIPFTTQESEEDDPLRRYAMKLPWFYTLWAEGLTFEISGITISIKNFVYFKSQYIFRTFSCTRVGDEMEFKDWVEVDIINLLIHLPAHIDEWQHDAPLIDREYMKRDKVKRLKALKEKILKI